MKTWIITPSYESLNSKKKKKQERTTGEILQNDEGEAETKREMPFNIISTKGYKTENKRDKRVMID